MNEKKQDILFEAYDLNGLALKNRIVLAPMTRSRTTQPGDIPNAMMAEYYAQRASAGLMITEATQISRQGQGYSFTPGIYSGAQMEGWTTLVEKVHQAGGTIFLQLWHVGRMSHPSFHPDRQTVGPSAIAPNATVWVADETGTGQMLECPVPRELSRDEIRNIVEDYRAAARNAIDSGFDGVEIHGGNGYLLDEFMRSSSNKRTDEYGGSIEKRLRFILEVVAAVVSEIGAEHTGIRLSPHNTARGMNCPEMTEAVYSLAKRMDQKKLGYIHFAEADWDNAPEVPEEFRIKIRELFSGTVIVAGNYDKVKAQMILEKGYADLVAFGRMFVSNPDLPERLKHDIPLQDYDRDTLFGGNEKGYTDYGKADRI